MLKKPFILMALFSVELIIFLAQACTPDTAADIMSPDARVVLGFSLNSDGVPHYAVTFADQEFIRPSILGFSFRDAPALSGNFKVLNITKQRKSSVWLPVWGQIDSVENDYTEMLVNLQEREKPFRRMSLEFRAYDDGVGFRYIIPEQENLSHLEITAENTQFNFAHNDSVWWTEADFDSYEKLYNHTSLSKMIAANTPVTMQTPFGFFASIHEADLQNYAGMTLKQSDTDSLLFTTELVPWPDGVKVKADLPITTPWRTIQLAPNAGALIHSHLIENLNRPNKIADVGWIKPMKYVGIWWGMHIDKYTWSQGPKHGATTQNTKAYIDFASEHNIPAVLVEGWNEGWENWGKADAYNFTQPYSDYDLPSLVKYADKKGVKLIAHTETGGDVPGFERQLEAAFSLYESLGIPAVKTGYAGAILPAGQHHHGQWMVNHYQKVVETAAKYHLMIDAHEPIAPTGLYRTWPNMMTREGARGQEYNAWSEGNPPDHTTILPFTRCLAGPLDYTPGIFDIKFDRYKKENDVHSTRAKELALMVVLYSPLQMAADLLENYENRPEFAFIEHVPTTFDETLVLNAKIGDYVTIARRKGDSWYIGSITDEQARTFHFPLDFLKPGQKYQLAVYADDPKADYERKPDPVVILKHDVTQGSVLELNLAAGGGAAVEIHPVVMR
ncbi:MAG: alpha-glucosidase [Candidatus Marinimicrobia bacterium CG1_02_48_14]|nr:MAG: alpha-glucosidase [Candidatus Marinimicrobia bacterium CG1_02_48_14]